MRVVEGETMLNIELDIQPETAQRLRHLMAHFDDQERFAQHIIDFQVQSLKRGILNLRLEPV